MSSALVAFLFVIIGMAGLIGALVTFLVMDLIKESQLLRRELGMLRMQMQGKLFHFRARPGKPGTKE